MKELDHGSSPSFGTLNTAKTTQIVDFLNSHLKLWQSVADQYPFEECRLVHHNYDLSKRWFVIFYAWNVATERKERKRISDPINKQTTIAGRLEVAEQIIKKTNADLRAGKVLGKRQLKALPKEIEKVATKRLMAAVDFFIDKKATAKRRHNYLRRFDALKEHLKGFYNATHTDDPIITEVDRHFVEAFFDHIRPKFQSSKTFNNYRGDFIAVLNFINKIEPGTVKDKPWTTTEKLKVVAKKHAAYSEEQIKKIFRKAHEMGFGQLVLFSQFEYYTLARPGEILAIKVRDIDLTNYRIIIHGESAKNWRDEYVTINNRFKQLIETSGILDADPDFYVFGWSPKEKGKRATSLGKPGPLRHPDEVYFYGRLVKVLTALDLYKVNPNYSLYSFKHSGAIALYLATLDIMAVQEQCRHKHIAQTSLYLRDLGLLRNESPVRKWNGTI